MQKRLAKHLMATDGHLGRTGKEMAFLARKAMVSVAMLQSVARGSRNFSDSAEKRVAHALVRAEQLHRKLRQARRG
jgi:hypothetical protein